MTARQQSLSAKVPRYAALFFPKDKTTGIVPTENIKTDTFKDKDTVIVTFNEEDLSAQIILMSNSRATLSDAIEEFEPMTSENQHQEQSTNNKKSNKKTTKKKPTKPACETIASGAAECSSISPPPVTTAKYDIDSTVNDIVQLSNINLCVRETQTELETVKVNNSTQTEPDCRIELLDLIMKKMEGLERMCK